MAQNGKKGEFTWKIQHIPYIGEALKRLRNDKNLTQQQLSSLCSINRPYISMLERNVKQPKLTIIFLLAAGLEMKPSELVREIVNYY
ncbi:helix-turn-helix domain-containing protein [Neobacillus vireti]|uniref:helix-turn-helix domain-containing protein n=1 Tax=Neobacillus vireti TaxID=220686 RepID=UPI0009E3836B